jgi:citrate synthase
MSEWVDRVAALTVLGVRPQTLYAYVSRGQIGVMPDPANPRRSLYRAEDIEGMNVRRARGRRVARIAESTMDWGEPAITTRISTIHHGTLVYRGVSAIPLAETQTLEQTAALLWETTGPVTFPVVAAAPDPWHALADAASSGEPMLGRGTERLQRDAAASVARLAACLGAASDARPIHERLAKAWSPRKTGAARIRQALVLIADHELNASTFATRVAASTGASMAASLLAGLSTLSGPRHGGAGAALAALIEEADRAGSAVAVTAWLARGLDLPGFGHPLYPEGDPRAVMLLGGLTVDPLLADLRDAVDDATGRQPNIDFALVAMTRADQLPTHAPFALFVLGRSVGWAAHAMEQIRSGQLIRPRARYEGALP